MDKKKFKILAIVDGVLIVALVVFMFALKGKYNDQAQASVKEQVGAYKATVNTALQDQWKSMDQYGMAWKLVYATVTGAKTEAAFNANVQKIFEDKDARFKQLSYMYTAASIPAQVQNDIAAVGLAEQFLLKDEGGVKEIACGKNCVAKFTFVKGKLKESDYKALVEYKFAENFSIGAPAEFKFE
ncbi:MAG: hypothetical protein IKZ45_06065 [Fibrobacter sp.]|jgi:hypothetical protein|nr:hypothetical protein [Fibrobacter sp.]